MTRLSRRRLRSSGGPRIRRCGMPRSPRLRSRAVSAPLRGAHFFEPDNSRFDSEKLLAYEIGGKTAWADGRVIVNGALFFQDYTDKQVGVTQFDSRIQSDVSSIENAGEAEIWGIELDVAWEINEHFYVSGAYTWLDAEYTKFDSTTASGNEIARTQFARQRRLPGADTQQ